MRSLSLKLIKMIMIIIFVLLYLFFFLCQGNSEILIIIFYYAFINESDFSGLNTQIKLTVKKMLKKIFQNAKTKKR